MALNLEPCASGCNANPALVPVAQWLLPLGWWSVLPCCASQHKKFVGIIRLISLKWLNWRGIGGLRARSKGHKFHPLLHWTVRRHGACASSAPHCLLWGWVFCCFWTSFYPDTLTGFTELHTTWKEQVLVFVLGEALPVTLGGFGSAAQWGVCFAAGLKVSVNISAWHILKCKIRTMNIYFIMSSFMVSKAAPTLL